MSDGKSVNWLNDMKDKHAEAVLLLVVIVGSFAAGCVSGWMIAMAHPTVPSAEEMILVPIRVSFKGWTNPPNEVLLVTAQYTAILARDHLVKITEDVWVTQSKYAFSVSVARDSTGQIVSTSVHEQYLPKEYFLESYAPNLYLVDYLYLHTIETVWTGTWPLYADLSIVNVFRN